MTSELGQRIAVTVVALLVYRLGTHIPLPGIDPLVWEQIFRSHAGGLLSTVNFFSGGGIQRLAIFALGIMPYVSAAVVVQLMAIASSKLARLREDEKGRRRLDRYTLGLTIVIAAFQSYGIANALEGVGNVVAEPGVVFRLSTVLTLTGGTVFLVWLADVITVRGLGNGIALLLAIGFVTELIPALVGTLVLSRQGVLSPAALLTLVVVTIAVTALIAFVELARRRLVVTYGSRTIGDRAIEGRSVEMPLKVNMAGLVPSWLVTWLVLLAMTAVGLIGWQVPDWWSDFIMRSGQGYLLFAIVSVILIVPCALLYCALVFDPDDAAERLKRHGGAIAGIEPGEQTAAHLDHIVSRITVVGALYLGLVALIPEVLIAYLQVPFYFGSISLMIVVCTFIDLRTQMQAIKRIA
jgi:preprotein translocase subunit SecY